jgi:hypothetical protein
VDPGAKRFDELNGDWDKQMEIVNAFVALVATVASLALGVGVGYGALTMLEALLRTALESPASSQPALLDNVVQMPTRGRAIEAADMRRAA